MVDDDRCGPISSGVRVIRDYLSLIRAANCVIAAAAVWVGAWLVTQAFPILPVALTSIAAFLVCAAGNILNDVVDIEIDRINRPNRALVRQVVTVPRAKLLVVAINLGAILVSLFVSLMVGGVVLFSVVLLFWYNLKLKHIPVAGNLVIALLSALTFVVGGMSVDTYLLARLPGPLVPAAYALLFHFVREMIKDVEDMEGDRQAGVRTLPQRIGKSSTLALALSIYLLLVLLTLVPIYFGWFGRMYEIITVYVVDLPLLALLIFVWGNPTPRLLRIGSTALKIGMLLGLVALVLGGQQI